MKKKFSKTLLYPKYNRPEQVVKLLIFININAQLKMKTVFNKDMSLAAMAAIVMSAVRADETATKRIAALLDMTALSFVIDQNVQIPESVSIVNSDVFELATGISVNVINDFEIQIRKNREIGRFEVVVHISGYNSEDEKKAAKYYNEGEVEHYIPIKLLPDYGMDWE